MDSLSRLNGKNLDDIGVGEKETALFEGSCAASIGICAMLDCCSSALVTVSDAVAALSCESARADVTAFDMPASGDGSSIKVELDVAGDMKVLLFGSKLVGQNDSEPFTEIPAVHGSFREAVRSLHGRVRVELNSSVRVKKAMNAGNNGKEKALLTSVLPLAVSIQSMSQCSLGRAKLTIESISDDDLRSKVAEAFKNAYPSSDWPGERFQSITEKAASGVDYVGVFHHVYAYLVEFRKVLAWEAALALFAIVRDDDSIEKKQICCSTSIKQYGETSKDEKKREKKRKTAGKGTSVIRQLLKDRIVDKNETSIEDAKILAEWAEVLSLCFDPKDAGLDALLAKVKEIIESNEVRRLPKIPKVRTTNHIKVLVFFRPLKWLYYLIFIFFFVWILSHHPFLNMALATKYFDSHCSTLNEHKSCDMYIEFIFCLYVCNYFNFLIYVDLMKKRPLSLLMVLMPKSFNYLLYIISCIKFHCDFFSQPRILVIVRDIRKYN